MYTGLAKVGNQLQSVFKKANKWQNFWYKWIPDLGSTKETHTSWCFFGGGGLDISMLQMVFKVRDNLVG